MLSNRQSDFLKPKNRPNGTEKEKNGDNAIDFSAPAPEKKSFPEMIGCNLQIRKSICKRNGKIVNKVEKEEENHVLILMDQFPLPCHQQDQKQDHGDQGQGRQYGFHI